MKKLLSFILIIALAFTLVGCYGNLSLYKIGTKYLYGEEYSYKIYGLKEIGSQTDVVNISFKRLEGSYVYDLYVKGYSSVSYVMEGDYQNLELTVIKSGESLTLPQGTIDVSSVNDYFIHIVFSSELCKELKIEFVLSK